MLKFNDFIKESSKYRTNTDYMVGDIVYIYYWLTGDMTPVEIIEKKSNNYYIVSHKVKNSNYFNAPEHGVKKDDIVGRFESVSEPVNSLQRKLENPTFDPDVSGSIPNWNSFNSNDIAV